MSNEDVTIRPATPADAPAVVDVINGAYRGTPDGEAGWTTEANLVTGPRIDGAGLREVMARPRSVVLVAEIDGGVVGSVHVERTDDDHDACELGLFSVRVDVQDQGIGRRLLEAAERWARDEQGASRMVLYVVTVRTELLEWYQRRGYRRTGDVYPFEGAPDQGFPMGPLEFERLERDLD